MQMEFIAQALSLGAQPAAARTRKAAS